MSFSFSSRSKRAFRKCSYFLKYMWLALISQSTAAWLSTLFPWNRSYQGQQWPCWPYLIGTVPIPWALRSIWHTDSPALPSTLNREFHLALFCSLSPSMNDPIYYYGLNYQCTCNFHGCLFSMIPNFYSCCHSVIPSHQYHRASWALKTCLSYFLWS